MAAQLWRNLPSYLPYFSRVFRTSIRRYNKIEREASCGSRLMDSAPGSRSEHGLTVEVGDSGSITKTICRSDDAAHNSRPLDALSCRAERPSNCASSQPSGDNGATGYTPP